VRTIKGNVDLPANTPKRKAGSVLVEVRDISLADAPSTVVAEQRLEDVPLEPNGQIGFKLQVPDVEPNRTLSLRAHVSMDGSGQVKSGDLLTTAHHPVPSTGTPDSLEIPVVAI
jgi:uncharacterized lipoprotein YbaY